MSVASVCDCHPPLLFSAANSAAYFCIALAWSTTKELVRNEQVWHRCKEEGKSYFAIKKEANWIGHFLRRNYFLRVFIEGKIKKVK